LFVDVPKRYEQAGKAVLDAIVGYFLGLKPLRQPYVDNGPHKREDFRKTKHGVHRKHGQCPCCSPEDVQNHNLSMMMLAMSDPKGAVEKIKKGDIQMLMGVSNCCALKDSGIGKTFFEAGFIPAVTEMYNNALQTNNYQHIYGCLLAYMNMLIYGDEVGQLMEDEVVKYGGVDAFLHGLRSEDYLVKSAAVRARQICKDIDIWKFSCGNNECSLREKTMNQFRKCGRCGVTSYCSKECQTVHWKLHKTTCKPKA
jgi:hypothetical protein